MTSSKKTREWTFLDWLADLERWTAAGCVTHVDSVVFQNAPSNLDAWMEEGYAWIKEASQNPAQSQQLARWIAQGFVDPLRVRSLLDDNNLRKIHLDEGSLYQKQEYEGCLFYEWPGAVGPALLFSKGRLGAEHGNGVFLEDALTYFSVSSKSFVHGKLDATHEQWLQHLCEEHAWARKTIALSMLQLYSELPVWPWVFDEALKTMATVDDVRRLLTATDPQRQFRCKEPSIIALHQERMGMFRTQAPHLYDTLLQVHRTYPGLWGERPDDFEAGRLYLDARAHAVHALIQQSHTRCEWSVNGLLDASLSTEQVMP